MITHEESLLRKIEKFDPVMIVVKIIFILLLIWFFKMLLVPT